MKMTMRRMARRKPIDIGANIRRIESHIGPFDKKLLERIPTTEELNRNLISAANHGELEKVKVLSDQGAEPSSRNKVGMRAIDCARIQCYFRVVEFLEGKANKKMFTAIKDGNLKKLEKALDEGADPNAKTETGITMLIAAIGFHRPEMVELLVKNGANVNMLSKSGHTPLMMAVIVADLKLVNFLVKNGADPDFENGNLVGPKSLAAMQRHTAILNCLEKKTCEKT